MIDATWEYEPAVTKELTYLLVSQEALPVEGTEKAFDKISNTWFDGHPLSWEYLRRRNFAINPVRPWPVPQMEDCTSGFQLPDPTLSLPSDTQSYYVVRYKVPSVHLNPILRSLFEISPGFDIPPGNATFYIKNTDFMTYIARIQDHARTKYGSDFDKP